MVFKPHPRVNEYISGCCQQGVSPLWFLSDLMNEAFDAGEAAAKAALGASAKAARRTKRPKGASEPQAALEPAWFVPATGALNEGNKHFIDFQNDVTVKDV